MPSLAPVPWEDPLDIACVLTVLHTKGFNFNETCGVLPSCVDDDHPAKYEPISCEEWVRLRFEATNVEAKEAKEDR